MRFAVLCSGLDKPQLQQIVAHYRIPREVLPDVAEMTLRWWRTFLALYGKNSMRKLFFHYSNQPTHCRRADRFAQFRIEL